MPTVFLVFSTDLDELLTVPNDGGTVTLTLDRRASIKDIIESLGVPHTEVGRLLIIDTEVDFSHIPANGERISVLAQAPPTDVLVPSTLRPVPLPAIRFLVDINVAKLAPLLRMVGMDATFSNPAADTYLADLACTQQLILLTRDTALLKRARVVHGHLVRAVAPRAQLREIIDLYGLRHLLRPFSRCMACNTPLAPVAKESVNHRLEPLTKKYYHEFQRCTRCHRIYWAGSHRDRMEKELENLLAIDPAAGNSPLPTAGFKK